MVVVQRDRPRPLRVRLRSVLAVVALVGGVAGVGACAGDGGAAGEPPEPATAQPSTPAPTAFASPPEGAEVVVAETGFSTSRYEGDASAQLLSYGVIIENPTRFAALDVFVHIHLLDSEGRPVDEISGEPAEDPQPGRQAVTRLLPGERTGLGRTVPHYGAEVTRLAVEVEVGQWSPVHDGFWWYHPVTASEVTAREGTQGPTVSFTVDAAYPGDTVRGELWIGGHFTAIFRDHAGAVVGGADCCHPGTGRTMVDVPPGLSQAQLRLEHGMPALADPSRTEIYLPDPQENLPG